VHGAAQATLLRPTSLWCAGCLVPGDGWCEQPCAAGYAECPNRPAMADAHVIYRPGRRCRRCRRDTDRKRERRARAGLPPMARYSL